MFEIITRESMAPSRTVRERPKCSHCGKPMFCHSGNQFCPINKRKGDSSWHVITPTQVQEAAPQSNDFFPSGSNQQWDNQANKAYVPPTEHHHPSLHINVFRPTTNTFDGTPLISTSVGGISVEPSLSPLEHPLLTFSGGVHPGYLDGAPTQLQAMEFPPNQLGLYGPDNTGSNGNAFHQNTPHASFWEPPFENYSEGQGTNRVRFAPQVTEIEGPSWAEDDDTFESYPQDILMQDVIHPYHPQAPPSYLEAHSFGIYNGFDPNVPPCNAFS